MKKIKTGPDPKNLNKKALKKGAQGTQRSLGAPLYSGGPKIWWPFWRCSARFFDRPPRLLAAPRARSTPGAARCPNSAEFAEIWRFLRKSAESGKIWEKSCPSLRRPVLARACARLGPKGSKMGTQMGARRATCGDIPRAAVFDFFSAFFPFFSIFFRLFFRPCSTPSRILGSVRTPKIFPDIEE